jgi:hypothetical protein
MAERARTELAEGVSVLLTQVGGTFKPLGHPSNNSSMVLVETGGIEPPPSECKTDMLPLTPSPR